MVQHTKWILWMAVLGCMQNKFECKADADSPERKDLQTNFYTSPHSEIYVLDKHFDWIDKDVEIYDYEGNVAYLLSFLDDQGRSLPQESQFMLKSTRGQPSVKSDSAFGWCGFDHTYHADNGLKIELKTRMLLPDRWYLEANHLADEKYVFNRSFNRISGDILDSNTGRLVAKISDKDTIEKPWVIQKIPSVDLYMLTSDGSIPASDLLLLLVSAVTRANHCQL
ncbi:hypothetical protein DFH28DRAFT_973361 [Melampsora americana]|nr:hypothetical protein DFH28DRAFT_976460 [Melampsora americana]KAH9813920.1 hypothetical protein DFH28DRAFT_973361 [Melampsora americana]